MDDPRSSPRVGREGRVAAGEPRAALKAIGLAIVVLLVSVSVLARRGTLPSDGLWFDDSWVAAGAIHGDPTDLLTAGSGHPGFTGLLMAVNRLGGGGLSDLGVPSLVAGIATPVLLYAALRWTGYSRSIGLVVSAALAVAPVHILYSGRVKGYTLDTLGVLGTAVAVPMLARIRWRWSVGLAWAAGAFLVGTFSGYLMVATAMAGVMLVLHPSGDRPVRVVAVAGQGLAQLAYFLAARTKTDLAEIESWMERLYDGHIEPSANPVTFGGEVLRHLRRLAEVFPGGHGGWLTVFIATILVGLVAAAVRGKRRSETLIARYLLALVMAAFVGAVLDQFPFGTSYGLLPSVSAGGRHTLWLVPALAFGLAAALSRVRSLVSARWSRNARVFDAVVVAAALAVLVYGYEPASPAPYQGSQRATRFVDASVGENDVVIVMTTSTYSFAVSTSQIVTLKPTPDHMVGFAPVYTDGRFHTLLLAPFGAIVLGVGAYAADYGSPEQVREWTATADRVFVQAQAPFGPGELELIGEILEEEGFELDRHTFDAETVDLYHR